MMRAYQLMIMKRLLLQQYHEQGRAPDHWPGRAVDYRPGRAGAREPGCVVALRKAERAAARGKAGR